MRHILIVILFMGCFQPMALFTMDQEASVKLRTIGGQAEITFNIDEIIPAALHQRSRP
jgi:hypothetical protein